MSPPASSASDERAPVDVLIVSLGSTAGLRRADAELEGALRRAGATVAIARAARPRPVRTLAATDLGWAIGARRGALAALARVRPRAVLYSTTTAALFGPVAGAVRFDAVAAGNRPGRHGIWQRPREQHVLASAPLLVPWSARALDELPGDPVARGRSIVVPVPVGPSGLVGGADTRHLAAVTYAADPQKKGLDRVLATWERVRRADEQLVVAGGPSGPLGPGARGTGLIEPDAYRALLRRARVFVTAPRREDHGLAQLEALADGAVLVTTPAPGPYVALPIARELDPRLVTDNLDRALRTALDDPRRDYAARAAAALAPLRRDVVDAVVADRLLPALLG